MKRVKYSEPDNFFLMLPPQVLEYMAINFIPLRALVSLVASTKALGAQLTSLAPVWRAHVTSTPTKTFTHQKSVNMFACGHITRHKKGKANTCPICPTLSARQMYQAARCSLFKEVITR